MKRFEPDYYNKFSCIADNCKHSCCVGWEIDIDDDTVEKYQKFTGTFGEKLRCNIVKEGDTAHFCLTENERCPFLDGNNLCEIILNLGEENISQICTEHPRFYNEFSSRLEVGLGLCCEEAARIILSNKEKTFLVQTEGENESEEDWEFFEWRDELFAFVQDREISLSERLEGLSHIKITEEIITLFKSLECLDETWKEKLDALREAENSDFGKMEIPFEQLLMYFLYRHTKDALYDGRYAERIAFCVLSVLIINAVFDGSKDKTMETLIEISRMYSAEIEYSEENTEKILEKLSCIL